MIHRILFISAICLTFTATEILAQCGADGTQPCGGSTTKKAVKPNPKPVNPTSPKKKTAVKKKKKTDPIDDEDNLSVALEDVQAEFHSFAVELNNDPSAQGYILNFGKPGEIKFRERVVKMSIKRTGVDPSRITQMNCGVSSDRAKTIFHIVPAGFKLSENCGENAEVVMIDAVPDEKNTILKKSVTPDDNSPCPAIEVTGPGAPLSPGETMTFTASVVGGSMMFDLSYNWSVSAGIISSGQGTPAITVDTAGLKDTTLTATVVIGKMKPEYNCADTAFDSGIVRIIY